ncbi:hypothetical protein K2Z83_25090 [Oscillochloris sp. ZM17-4]|uniref:hypothetical protein n=1 Tax=Oscillochloris sp. ZM17-4 TaxID=2866714 RepID=UPI001C73A086|nr:hypothetical protein [Oscillochloris sp. ZM17-4]MBX0330938.1 hypothetical protein [Oscillochloris sp. ZM17-4]
MSTYQITVEGHLDDRWAEWLAPLELERRPDGTTSLGGDLADQSALFGLLQKIHDMNLQLLSVDRVDPDDSAGGPAP